MAKLDIIIYERDGNNLSRSCWIDITTEEKPKIGDRVHPADTDGKEFFELIEIKNIGTPGYKDGAYVCKNSKGKVRYFYLDALIKHSKSNETTAPKNKKKVSLD